VIHDAQRRCQDDETEVTRWQKVHNPFFYFGELHIEAGGNNSTLVQAAHQANNDLASPSVINDLEFADVFYRKRVG